MGLVYLDRESGTSLHQQIYTHIRSAILDGHLSPGTRIPSSRHLATELGVARIVVLEAFDRLLAEGYLETHRGAGTFVMRGLPTGTPQLERLVRTLPIAPRRALPPVEELQDQPRPVTVDFRPGVPALDLFPRERWAQLLSEKLRQGAPGMLDYGPASGRKELRSALARYLVRARGLPLLSTERIMITSGTAQAIDLLATTCIQPGDAVAVEDPCPSVVYISFRQRGARVVPIPVDNHGLCVDHLPTGAGAPRLVYVTPSHQYPLGGTLTLERRIRLLSWAEEQQALIIEDDYDSEFRYEGDPIPALAGIDRLGRVAYLGSFSKTLFPSLRVGYSALPEQLVSAFAAQKWQSDRSTHGVEQLALAEWLDNGHFERHVRRMRKAYVERRQELVEALDRHFGGCITLHGASAGLHLCVTFNLGLREQELMERAEAFGVRIYPASPCFVQVTPDHPQLIFGYGGLAREQIRLGVELLARAIRT